jgi:hypothetical protein
MKLLSVDDRNVQSSYYLSAVFITITDSNISSWKQHHTLLVVTVFCIFCILNLKFWAPDTYLGNACTLTFRKLIQNEECTYVCMCVCVCDGCRQCKNLSTTASSASHCCISRHTYSLCPIRTQTSSCLCSAVSQSQQHIGCTMKLCNMYWIIWLKLLQVILHRYCLAQEDNERNSMLCFWIIAARG